MNDLDAVASEYKPNAVTAVENDLILNWYPKRIVERFNYCGSLLELGVGHGHTASIFNKACDRHVIVEGSQLVIDLFLDKNKDFNGSLVHEYFEKYSTTELFDIVVMGFILEHVDNPDFILDKYKKYLRPEGKLYIAVPNAKSLNRRLGLELGLIDDIYSLNENDLALGHKRQYCLDNLRNQLITHGYKITLEEGIYLKPLPLSVLKKIPEFEANLNAMLKVGVDYPDLCVGLLLEAVPV